MKTKNTTPKKPKVEAKTGVKATATIILKDSKGNIKQVSYAK